MAGLATRVLNIDKFISDISARPAIWNRNYHCNKGFMEETWDELSQRHGLPKVTLKAKWKGLRDNFRVEFKRIPRDETTGEMLISPDQHDSKWAYYKPLLFLVEHMRNRNQKVEKIDQFYYHDMLEFDDSNSMVGINVNDFLASASNTPPMQNFRTTRDGLIEIPDDDDCNRLQHNLIDGLPLNMGTLLPPKNKLTNGNFKRRRLDDCDFDDLHSDTKTSNNDINNESSNKIKHDDDYHYLMSLHPFMGQLNPEQKLKIRMKIQKLIFKELYSPNFNDNTNNNNNNIDNNNSNDNKNNNLIVEKEVKENDLEKGEILNETHELINENLIKEEKDEG